ncbi:hypothetical protein [Oceanicoccus sagamiensis]|uniref:Uncharacterized protein n=1 Tax=Oceanicoccus sagamiensis TaxID=716816 RepID=A0A1X9N9K7_9GAMM|nr:hypothetical protein [Oceanicoccus sagamiensis]ARN72635.1 hypothetical protein BST96_00010 [Oceanicoccus sagamiensis]ARN76229.1 hypothetical protein BST96_20250 [Oceanicoccus sagamiensis]
MHRDIIYQSIRDEIIDQKRCQFQLFSIALAVTSAVLAYAAATKVHSLVYITPMLLIELALIVIFDKAVTIQRKVGYLKKIEQNPDISLWRWETDLDNYRGHLAVNYQANLSGESRKHSYVTSVGVMMMVLALFCAGLFYFGPDGAALPLVDNRAAGWIDIFVLSVLLSTAYFFCSKRKSLVTGVNCSAAISAKWDMILQLRPGE